MPCSSCGVFFMKVNVNMLEVTLYPQAKYTLMVPAISLKSLRPS